VTTAFMFYAWLVLAVCSCCYVWAKRDGWSALLLAIGWLMVAVVLGIIA
jgi:hypothetical protein